VGAGNCSRAASAPADSTDTIATLLRELVTEVRGLRADQRERRPVSALSRSDRALMARLLPAAGGVFGSEQFLTRDLFESEAAAVKLVTRGLNVRQVGRLFRRGEGQAIDGYMIQRDGAELNAILWRILKG
jgi:hypothetical protein